MSYRELIKHIQQESGFSDAESKTALDSTVSMIAERLTENEREDFASQLPPELQDVALAATLVENAQEWDMIEELVEQEGIDASHAKKQLLSAWDVLRDAISKGEVEDIKAQLPGSAAALLY